MAKTDIYELITNRVIERIQTEGKLPWHQPWKHYLSNNGQPQNLVSKKPYRGINIWILSAMGFNSPFWVTYKQASQLGGTVKKGSKGTPVVYWCWFEKENEKTGKKERIPSLRYYTVFNVEQCEGLESKLPQLEEKTVDDIGSIEACENIIANMPKCPTITFNESTAYYRYVEDRVNMPKKESFDSLPEYYSTFFHELAHSTGHENRCARMRSANDWHRFGSDPYAKEELCAEMCASFLCSMAGIQNQVEDNSVAYIQNWISRLKDDKKLLVQAAAQAQKAADFILGVKFEDSPTAD